MGPGFVSREWVPAIDPAKAEHGASMGPGFVSREWAVDVVFLDECFKGFNGARLREPGVGCRRARTRRLPRRRFNGARLREPGVGEHRDQRHVRDRDASMGPGFVSREWDIAPRQDKVSVCRLQWGPAS